MWHQRLSKVAELFCRSRFGDAAVSMAFERGLVVDHATGWNMSVEEQMNEVEQRLRDEESMLLLCSPTCSPMSLASSTLVELTQAGKMSEVSRENLVHQRVTHLKFFFRMFETQRSAARLFLHQHPWDAWSRFLSFVKEMVDGCAQKRKATCVDSS